MVPPDEHGPDPQYLALLSQAKRVAQQLVAAWPDGEPGSAPVTSSRIKAARRALDDLAVLADQVGQLDRPHDRQSSGRRPHGDVRGSVSAEEPTVPALERQVGVKLDHLASWMALTAIKGFGPQKAKELKRVGVSPEALLRRPDLLPHGGATGDRLIQDIRSLTHDDIERARQRALTQMQRAAKVAATILTYDHQAYPQLVMASNNPIPVLYARGNLEILKSHKVIACVGSRQIDEGYAHAHASFASRAAVQGWAIASGFALGADTFGHRAAVDAGGVTVCVMPAGLDRPFPPENRELWRRFETSNHVVMLSEFPFGTGASSMNLRKRNKLIVAIARGVLVSQSSEKGGAMNAFRFALEQRKPVATFEADGAEQTSGNRLIAGETRVPVRTLPLRGEERWDQWLHELSSSI